MCSTPPAICTSSQCAAMLMAASLIAWRLDAQLRLTVTPPVSTGRSAARAAIRAMSNPCSPCCWTHPQRTSSMSFGSTPVRPTRALMTCTESTSDRTSRKIPDSAEARPIGVRTASMTTARPHNTIPFHEASSWSIPTISSSADRLAWTRLAREVHPSVSDDSTNSRTQSCPDHQPGMPGAGSRTCIAIFPGIRPRRGRCGHSIHCHTWPLFKTCIGHRSKAVSPSFAGFHDQAIPTRPPGTRLSSSRSEHQMGLDDRMASGRPTEIVGFGP